MSTQNNPVEAGSRKNLTKLEWFGLFSGIIGLVVDLIALTSIFTASLSPVKDVGVWVWIFTLLSIIYTIAIFSFYSRRFLSSRHKTPGKSLTEQQQDRVESGAAVVTQFFGITLTVLYLLSLGINNPFQAPDVWMPLLVLGLPVALVGPYGIHLFVRFIYEAADPYY